MSAPAVIWALHSDKAGDNAQIDALVRATGLAVERKRLRFKGAFETGKPWFSASLRHLDAERSAPLQPPWPRVIVTAGRRPAMAALWVKAQSGGATKVVLVGRPKRWLRMFDLIVAASQYELPPRDNIVPIALPLVRADADAVRSAAGRFAPALDSLPRPLVALMLGGGTRPYRFDLCVVRSIISQVRAYQEGSGSLFVLTSRRTPKGIGARLERELAGTASVYQWGAQAENPYLALLGSADLIAVTGDSPSMITEAVRAGKPVVVCPLPRDRDWFGRTADWLLGGTHWQRPNLWQRFCAYVGTASYPRRLERLHDQLFAEGRAVPLGAPLPRSLPPQPVLELDAAVARIQQLAGAPPERAVAVLPVL